MLVPADFAVSYPSLAAIDLLGTASPPSAMLAGNAFNALAILLLLPLALRAVRSPALQAEGSRQAKAIAFVALTGLLLAPVGIGLIQRAISVLGLA